MPATAFTAVSMLFVQFVIDLSNEAAAYNATLCRALVVSNGYEIQTSQRRTEVIGRSVRLDCDWWTVVAFAIGPPTVSDVITKRRMRIQVEPLHQNLKQRVSCRFDDSF